MRSDPAGDGLAIGVDGAPGSSIDEILREFSTAGVLAVDIPIGLPDRGPRAADVAARQVLRARRSSVFCVPSRAVLLEEIDYAGACRRAHERGEGAPSKQVWALRQRIEELDALTHCEQARR